MRRLRRHPTLTWALFVTVVAAVVVSGTGIFVARAADPIKIGLGMALTGGLSANGKPALLALQIWKDDVNKKGGLLGRPVELIVYDDQTNPSTVPGIYTKLLDVDKVNLIISGYGTNLIAPLLPIAMERKLMLIGMFGLANNEIVPIPVPGRMFLQKLNVVGSIAAFNAFIYNRAFGNPTDAISTITTASGKAKLTFKWPHRFAINDRLTVAGSSVGGYNVTHIITHMLSEFEVVTDRDYTADATGGTATLIIGVTASETFVGKVMFHTDVPHVFKVGDTITVAGHSVVGYNASHVVTRVIDDNTVVTNTNFTTAGAGGTVVLAVATNVQANHEVVPSTAAATNIVRYEKDYGKPVVNQDVIRKVLGDLTAAGVDCDEARVSEALRNKEIEARRQIIESTNL